MWEFTLTIITSTEYFFHFSSRFTLHPSPGCSGPGRTNAMDYNHIPSGLLLLFESHQKMNWNKVGVFDFLTVKSLGVRCFPLIKATVSVRHHPWFLVTIPTPHFFRPRDSTAPYYYKPLGSALCLVCFLKPYHTFVSSAYS